jgi:endonuclease/exonuclease/phosphatase family metal-dependent hydrolase
MSDEQEAEVEGYPVLQSGVLILSMLGLLLISSAGCLASSRPATVWLGIAPFCAASSRDCDIMSLSYVRSDTSGNGLPCVSGEKVLCAAPMIVLNPTTPDRLTKFTVVQYNIMDRPFWVGQEGQRERVCRIPQALAGGIAAQEVVDVIVFNESFSGICAGGLKLTDLLAYYGWQHYLPTVSAWWKPSNGGIFIASKWPIVTSQDMAYKTCHLSDCLAAKGVQYARVEKVVEGQAKRYHIFGTHMQAWGRPEVAAVRSAQARELARFVEQQEISPTEPVVLAGDLNTRGPDTLQFQALIDILGVSMPPIVGERRATMDVDNTLFGRGPWWVDYVLPSNMHQQPIKAELEATALRTAQEFAMCAEAWLRPFYVGPYASACSKTVYVRDLSDHYPVIGRFEYAN